MRDKLRNLFSGRQGMDELSKFQFWFGLAGFLIGCFLPGFLGRLFIWLGIFSLISAFVRAFSRQLDRREMENRAYLAYLDRWKNKYAAWKDRFSQRKSYRFRAGDTPLRPAESAERYRLGVAAPIISEGDLLGCVMLLMNENDAALGESEQKLAQTVAGFLGRQMES